MNQLAVQQLADVHQSANDDVFFEYGYVWLPYAIGAVVLIALGAVSAFRWRQSSPRTTELLLISGAVLAVVAAVILGLADGATDRNGLSAIDQPVLDWMVAHRSPALTSVMIVITEVGGPIGMTALAVGVGVLLLVKRHWGQAILVAVAAGGGGLLVRLGKATVGRQRPPVVDHAIEALGESFPSGHALGVAATLGVLVYIGWLHYPRRLPLFVTAAGLVVLVVGLSRVYLGVHWSTDVLAGWLIGIAWLLLCLTVRRVWRRSRRHRAEVTAASAGSAPSPAGQSAPSGPSGRRNP
ncbi:phosphatase PAP2 family protein [Nakamurella flava]|uniref:Phosphatase PAP2 family protein n=1 Tax=Nakamurella flava TaxID=2576308 RepID=A0A4U6QF86_9ACTN|nr:phosphatase PAP2 family protein [Nakamurella flava]TKV58702.1 phosphatase PAP2 family protein [Nakamurella flava]